MASGRFIKTKSNYTLKRKHVDSEIGGIYERDYMTINGKGEGNFKFAGNSFSSYQKKHRKAKAEDLGVTNIFPSSNDRIELKPDYESIKDFAFYGSAIELIRSSINGIMELFPASVTCRASKEDKGQFEVRNPYGIDIFSPDALGKSVTNPLRYMCISFSDYVLMAGGKEYPFTWESSLKNGSGVTPILLESACVDYTSVYTAKFKYADGGKNRTITVTKSYNKDEGEWEYKTDSKIEWEIRPSKEKIDEYFGKLSDFQRILLNTDTDPLYSATFLTPEESSDGIIFYKKRYVWPSADKWNPDTDGFAYKIYISSLTELAEYLDKYESDNLWRSMTHESIKGLDWTFIREIDDKREEETFDNGRIEPILRLWGRQYDNVKRYVDTIGYSNSVSYDQKKNLPDYCLTDSLQNSGWEVKQVSPLKKANVMASDVYVSDLYSGDRGKRNCFDCNIEFFRRLKLNSASIFAKKGTRGAIESLLALFGMKREDDYRINEYIRVARPLSGQKSYPSYEKVKRYNQLKDVYRIDKNDPLYGLPVKKVSLETGDGRSAQESYVIPWFDNGNEYDSNAYFQMKGGWGLRNSKEVDNPITGKNVTIETSADFAIYDETYPILRVMNKVSDLITLSWKNINTDDVIYVTDLSEMSDKYYFKGNTFCEISHYFVLKNKSLNTVIGYSENDDAYGWKNIPLKWLDPENWPDAASVEEKTDVIDAKRILYIESLEEDTKGNNPHNGFAGYDNGESYFAQFYNLFPERKFSVLSENEIDDMNKLGLGFDIGKGVEDNSKCYFFKDRLETNIQNPSWYPASADPLRYGGFYNPEGGEKDDEAAANSIINSKNLDIIFTVPEGADEEFKEDFKKYIINVVMFYVEQIIPSTSLLRYGFSDEDNESTKPGAICTECYEETRSYILGAHTNK